jgi:carbonic anhydrase
MSADLITNRIGVGASHRLLLSSVAIAFAFFAAPVLAADTGHGSSASSDKTLGSEKASRAPSSERKRGEDVAAKEDKSAGDSEEKGGGRKSEKGGHGAGHWSYESGPNGPENWGKVSSEFSTCASGKQQSPVDIAELVPVELANIQVDYQPGPLKVINNGHTIQFNAAAGSQMVVGDRTFNLLQVHFHAPSEHTLAGKRFEMEAHFVHKDEWGNLGVIGVMMKKGERNAALARLWENLPSEVGSEQPAGKGQLGELLPSGRKYYRYAGSLTTPPCSEGVSWFVLKDPVTVGEDQLSAFTKKVTANARPVQPRGNRQVLGVR